MSPKLDCSDNGELNQLRSFAATLGMRFEKEVRSGSEGNVLGIRSDHQLLSRRLDSRTYFLHDARWGVGRPKGVFVGTDREHFVVCRKILKVFGISRSEVAREVVLKESGQTARLDRETRRVEKGPVETGKHLAQIFRAVERLPVWSSDLRICLTEDKQIGFMQLHWPEISEQTILEAQCLSYRVNHGWKPPEQPGTDVESVEAGIVHSPAIGMLMDIYPAIRVIYKSRDSRYGQKSVNYYDRHGRAVPVPRIAIMLEEPRRERAQPRQQ